MVFIVLEWDVLMPMGQDLIVEYLEVWCLLKLNILIRENLKVNILYKIKVPGKPNKTPAAAGAENEAAAVEENVEVKENEEVQTEPKINQNEVAMEI